jgi:hypothetical protein
LGCATQSLPAFWTFTTSCGAVYENGQFVTAPLFINPFYATGIAITEANRAEIKVTDADKPA